MIDTLLAVTLLVVIIQVIRLSFKRPPVAVEVPDRLRARIVHLKSVKRDLDRIQSASPEERTAVAKTILQERAARR